ncbi:MAG TPA: hypothetical protein VFA28_00535 [Bryobacteraceae bacterium]|nr:hypothetical protein [Bryobacteraceae bacterium]
MLRAIATGYDLDDALAVIDAARARGEALSFGMVASCADILPLMARRGIVPDLLTDQASAHDPLNGYVPNGMTLEEAIARRRGNRICAARGNGYRRRWHA